MGKNNLPVYKTVLLKISGEALAGNGSAFDLSVVERIVGEIEHVYRKGINVGIVIGGGNIIRGGELSRFGFDRNQSDYMGMLATVINALFFEDSIHRAGVPVVVQSALKISTVTKEIVLKDTGRYLQERRIILFAGGTGSPYFTTDTAAALRACEIDADVLLKATKVEGVYDKDPVKYGNAHLYDTLTYEEVLQNNLKIMDMAAISLCREKGIPIVVFNLFQKGSIADIVAGKKIGTLIKER